MQTQYEERKCKICFEDDKPYIDISSLDFNATNIREAISTHFPSLTVSHN